MFGGAFASQAIIFSDITLAQENDAPATIGRFQLRWNQGHRVGLRKKTGPTFLYAGRRGPAPVYVHVKVPTSVCVSLRK
jgi:hypothetical protein